MGPKRKSSSATSSGGAGKKVDDGRETPLQAILLADSFMKTFRPITWDSPKVLLPLVNVPMLEYTVEFLAQNGVEELFIFCVWHGDLLQDYINNSNWKSYGMTIRCIYSPGCLSAGDALRELDSMSVIRYDPNDPQPFILISGDVISNMDLKKAIQYHKDRRAADKECIMTVVMKQVQKNAGIKSVLDDLVVAVDGNTNQLLLFDDNYKKEKVSLPIEILLEHPNMVYRTDLLDCQVDICSPELMLQFSDNFDYQDIRRDFIHNEVVNFTLGKHIYSYVLTNEYAARVNDPRTYHSICRDIVSRWVYPLVPDAQIVKGSNYVHSKRYIYKDSNCKISRLAKIGEGVVLGKDCIIEDGVVLERCVIGVGCHIQAKSVIIQSHLWTRSIVEPNVTITQSIICENVIVKANATVARGCILAKGVVIGIGCRIPAYTRISLSKKLENNENNQVSAPYDDVVGRDGKGFVWEYNSCDDYMEELETDDDEDVGADNGVIDVIRTHSIGCTEEEAWRYSLWDHAPPLPLDEDEDENDEEYLEYDNDCNIESEFLTTISEDVKTAYLSKHSPENVLLEIKGLKFRENRTYSDCIRGVIPGILFILKNVTPNPSVIQMVSKSRELLKEKVGWGYIILKPLIVEEEDETALIEAIEDEIIKENNLLIPIFWMLLKQMLDIEVLSEESLLKWAQERQADAGYDDEDVEDQETKKKVALFKDPKVQEFVKWLHEQDEEDDDEDEDDEDEDEDDE